MFTTQYWRLINSSLWGVKCCFLLECSDFLSEVKSIVITSFVSKTSYQQLLLQFYNCATAQSGDDCEKSKLSHFLAVTQSPFLLPHLLFWIYSYLLRFCSSVSQFSTVSNSYPPNHRPTVYPQSSTVPQNGLFLYYSPHLLNSHSCLVVFLSVVQKKQTILSPSPSLFNPHGFLFRPPPNNWATNSGPSKNNTRRLKRRLPTWFWNHKRIDKK